MVEPDPTLTRLRLDAALTRVAVIFRGMTARSDEGNCECHWGSAAELARLKVPDVELGLDLLNRTWRSDWDDPSAILRRVLPEFSRAMVDGLLEPFCGPEQIGYAFVRADWRQWPVEQFAAARELLDAWWAHTLVQPNPAMPVCEVLVVCAEASETLTPWLRVWEAQDHAVADRHLADAITGWTRDFMGGWLPWDSWNSWGNADERLAELATWLIRFAPARLGARSLSAELLHRLRFLGQTQAV
ncbi:hypothetical protein HII36_31400 [Nonomuraea sp. NN258]|uniref:hypothetical protein n=1 Tax=Nonomuraea antri TaxID=2730852 RepID=UPI0015683E45|nr:hypothetical protein [Nonomuraea antri]NRQ36307.1 hypothetical protein [Nonomuraea antri]